MIKQQNVKESVSVTSLEDFYESPTGFATSPPTGASGSDSQKLTILVSAIQTPEATQEEKCPTSMLSGEI